MKSGKLGFIGGGKMAEALVRGIISSGFLSSEEVVVSDPDSSRCSLLAEKYKVVIARSNKEVIAACRRILLAVKPQIMEMVLADIASAIHEETLFISIAAGLPLSFFKKRLPMDLCRLVRVMPNTPALVLAGAAAISPAEDVGREYTDFVIGLFNGVGKSVVLDEKHLDAVTGLSGSGPAYVFSFIEALVDGGVKVGLNRQVAEDLVLQTVYGSVLLAMQEREHPAVLRARVTSPGGTTISALHKLARGGFNGLVMDAVEVATERSRELGGF